MFFTRRVHYLPAFVRMLNGRGVALNNTNTSASSRPYFLSRAWTALADSIVLLQTVFSVTAGHEEGY